jgi:hypothetical protein
MSAHLATPSNDRGDLMSEPPATHGHEWPCCEGCLVCHRLASLIVKSLLWADSHGNSVGPVNHVLRAIRGHISPESLAIRILVLRRGLECPPGPLGNRLTRRPTCRVVLFWKMSRPLIPPAIFQVSFSRTASLPLPFSMRANPDRLLLLLWRLHCLKKR